MSDTNDKDMVCEAVGVFANEASMQAAIDDLLAAGFNQADISLMASEATVEKELGHRYEKVSEMEDDRNAPHAAYVSPESRGDAEGAAIGTLMYIGAGILMGPAALAGGGIGAMVAAAFLGGGTGAAFGSILALYVEKRHADYIEEQIEHGGLLLWVRAWNAEQEKSAQEILSRHSGKDVHVHQFKPE